MAFGTAVRQSWIVFRRQLTKVDIAWRAAKETRHHTFYEAGGRAQAADTTWYRGANCNFHPVRASFSEPNAVAEHVAYGWLPDKPFIARDNPITAFGSCFARHVSKFLVANGYNVFGDDYAKEAYVIRCGEGMVNTAAVAQQLLWGYGESNFEENLWYEKTGDIATYSEEVRAKTRSVFDRTDVFIITLGLSEVWYNKTTGDVFWRAIRKDLFDPEHHGFKVMSVEENKRNLETIYRCIRKHRGDAPIVFTLSPVPLIATFRPVSCITANSVSKAVLRVAVDEFMREHETDRKVFYFPSYEIVKDFCENPYLDDLRHVRPEVIELIMRTFQRYYLL